MANRSPPSILFVPVSGPRGSGEYVRCLCIAQAVQARWRDAEITFAISRQANYAGQVPFATRLLPSSPTFNSAEIKRILADLKPDIVVFDNAGRTQQLRYARTLGCRTVFISRTARKRRKAFRWSWLGMLDEHWIAFPPFIAGELSWLERFKLRLAGTLQVRYLGAIFPSLESIRADTARARLRSAGDYVLVLPGGGGEHPGFRGVPEQFVGAARRIAAQGFDVVMIAGPNFTAGLAEQPHLRVLRTLPIEQVIELLSEAQLVLTNGGSTLPQALALKRVCVCVSAAGDQPPRVRRAARAGLVVAPTPLAENIASSCLELLRDAVSRSTIEQRVLALDLRNGVPIAVDALERLWQDGRATPGRRSLLGSSAAG